MNVKELFNSIIVDIKSIKSLPIGMERISVYYEDLFHKDFNCHISTLIECERTKCLSFNLPFCQYVNRLHTLEIVTDYETKETKLITTDKTGNLTDEQVIEIKSYVDKCIHQLIDNYTIESARQLINKYGWSKTNNTMKMDYWNKCMK